MKAMLLNPTVALRHTQMRGSLCHCCPLQEEQQQQHRSRLYHSLIEKVAAWWAATLPSELQLPKVVFLVWLVAGGEGGGREVFDLSDIVVRVKRIVPGRAKLPVCMRSRLKMTLRSAVCALSPSVCVCGH
ncbi:hypothetical protein DQ04_17651000 [Trypanosoma grayi]|uniref:hypothetical protein n=1 Tax=Trypanosoma grayi TaxID=71804 RepID=UPI0004F4460E|nr:hypothetical protein DQ04_17651000 [Trypanosoma grayi]KEG05875.1 hypothetical protein DQ04_17651000 [Trypanosoma grayi]